MRLSFFGLFLLWAVVSLAQVFIPVETSNRKSVAKIELTDIGIFGITRKARPEFTKHLHTGIDIKRPKKDYLNPPFIFPIAPGKVISKRDEGPYSQLIIEHQIDDIVFWTIYEHVASIFVNLNEIVHPHKPMARFYSKEELDAYGWQFDHFHFEILKVRPIKIESNPETLQRRFGSYTMICYDQETLEKYFYNPIKFLEKYL
ncbi:M23 family metallopeptidase [Ekhidna sp.]